MIARFFAAVSRRRRAVIVVALVVAFGYALVATWSPGIHDRAHGVGLIVTGICVVLALAALGVTRPRGFERRPDGSAFRSVPPRPVVPFLALAFLTMVAEDAGTWARAPGTVTAWPAVVAALWLAMAWRETGVYLRPDGLRQHRVGGTLVVPWEAEPVAPTLPPDPRAWTVRLTYGRPDLVRRRGIGVFRNRVVTEDIDPRLLAAAIRYYTAHPEHRPAIGTQAEYARVMPHLLSSIREVRPVGAP